MDTLKSECPNDSFSVNMNFILQLLLLILLTLIIFSLAVAYSRSQDGWGQKGPLKDLWSNPPLHLFLAFDIRPE